MTTNDASYEADHEAGEGDGPELIPLLAQQRQMDDAGDEADGKVP